MKKSIFLFITLLCTFTYAKMMDAIAIIVEGEPITTAEIHAVQTQAHLSRQQAIDLLIQDRLQKAAMKDITIPESDVDKEVSRIAEQNGISIQKMQQILQKQGTSWSKYRESIRQGMKKKQFFQKKVATAIPSPTDDELKLFYRNHQEEFRIPKTIKVTEYRATTEQALKKFIRSGKAKGVHSKKKNLSTQNLNPSLMGMLLQTPNGKFTPPINAGDKYITYKVLEKSGTMQMPFESARGAVAARWRQQQQNKALKDYFQKMKTEANIQIIRK
jgi:parvulin-like peptidyl-prolyl isomerase